MVKKVELYQFNDHFKKIELCYIKLILILYFNLIFFPLMFPYVSNFSSLFISIPILISIPMKTRIEIGLGEINIIFNSMKFQAQLSHSFH